VNKPVILIGAGCPVELAQKLCQLGIPVLTTWQGIDRVPENSPVFCGRPGVIGQRAANIIQQKADLLIVVGARLDNEQVGHRMDNFAPNARKIVIDVDEAELDKLPFEWEKSKMDLSSEDAIDFFDSGLYSNLTWLSFCKNLYNTYRFELDGNKNTRFVDPYYFVNVLSDLCEPGDIIVPGSSGMQSCALMQAFKVKDNQKILLCNTAGAMGFEPMAIGAALANSGKRVIVVTGDGGFALNFQELEVARRLNLPIKYFVFSNGGYGSIASMQDARFDGFHVGSDAQSGFTLPNLEKVAAVWDMQYYPLQDNKFDAEMLRWILDTDMPSIVEVYSSLDFKYATKVGSTLSHSGAFEVDDMADMMPKLDLEEFGRIMEWGNE